tara:strand:+ start:47 stop:256 length:210 start_codon:yes stop_codon:yes gene_type:complete
MGRALPGEARILERDELRNKDVILADPFDPALDLDDMGNNAFPDLKGSQIPIRIDYSGIIAVIENPLPE